MEEQMLSIKNVSKQYKLGEIGGTTLRDELQRLGAKLRHKEDPTKRIGAKNYNKGEPFMALDNVSFDVKKGERIGIIGHNGAGKSTLLKLISRVTAPTGGSIGLNGRVASMLEVGTGFHPELTGRENIYMNGAILGMTKKEIDAKMEDIIEFSECRQFIDTPVKRYSSGMYVKLAFSVAAHLDSEIMIMDEVLAVGDMAFQKKCINKMISVSNEVEKTILYVSHNMSTIRKLCDRCIVLDKGKIVFDGDINTAISIYNKEDSLDDNHNSFDLSDIKRDWHFGKTVKMIGFAYKGKNSCHFEGSEKITIEITLDSIIPINNLKAVLTLMNEENVTLGSSIFGTYSVQSGMSSFCIEFDAGRIATGKYMLGIEIIETDKNGNYYSYDNGGTFSAPLFISNDMISGVAWVRKYWGAIRLF